MKNQMDHKISEYLNIVTDEMTFGEARASTRTVQTSHLLVMVELELSQIF